MDRKEFLKRTGLAQGVDAIFLVEVDSCTVTGNVVDISKAGITGIRLGHDGSYNTISGNTIVGRKVTNVFGIRHTTQGSYNQNNHNTITGNNIRDVGSGIDLEQSINAVVSNNTITSAASVIKTGLNNIFNASYAPIAVDPGWTLQSLAGFP